MSAIVPNQSVKRHSSAIAGGSGNGSKKRSRKPVVIPEDIWLDALKHLACQKWSKMRLVSSQLNVVVGRNVSRLPLAVIDYAAMVLKERFWIENKIIVSDSFISPNVNWFKSGGMAIDSPGDIDLSSAIISLDLKYKTCVDLCVLGPAQEKELSKYAKGHPWFSGNQWLPGRQFKSKVMFYAEFGPHRNQSSLASTAFFLKLLYDPSTFVKELSMYAFDNKLTDILFAGEEERNIRCGTFSLMGEYDRVDAVREAMLWMEKNVRADRTNFTKKVDCHNGEFSTAICNYIFGASWINVNQVVSLGKVKGVYRFFNALIKKFRTVDAVKSTFPIIVFLGYRMEGDSQALKLLFPKKCKLDDPENYEDPKNSEGYGKAGNSECAYSEGSENGETYIISNGLNRMRVKFVRRNANRRKYQMNPYFPGTYEYPNDVRITVKARK